MIEEEATKTEINDSDDDENGNNFDEDCDRNFHVDDMSKINRVTIKNRV